MAQKVLLTGASGGFGQLITNTLINAGHEVVASMRGVNGKNKEVAEKLESIGAKVVEIDVTSDESVKDGIVKAIELLGEIDVVINNAGLGVVGMQEHFTTADLQKLFDINVIGVQRVNREVLPHLRAKGSGLIIYISSLLGRIPLPFYGPYNATKWALEALAENYRIELNGFGVDNVIVEPGGYPTSFMNNLMKPSDQTRETSYGEFMHAPQQMFEGFEQALSANPAQNPQKVADEVLQVIETPAGQRAFRNVVDSMGMGEHVKGYNDHLDQVTKGIFGAFHIDGMLELKA